MKVFLIVLFVLFLIAMIWLGVEARFSAGRLTVWVRVVFLRLRVYPIKKKKPAKTDKKEKKPKKKKAKPKADKPKRPKQKPDIWGLVGLGLRAAGRLRRKITISLILLSYVAGSKDPYNTAMQYGYVSAAVGALMPILRKAFNLKRTEISVNADFELEKPKIEAEVRLGLFLWQIIYIAAATLMDYVKLQKENKQQGEHKYNVKERA